MARMPSASTMPNTVAQSTMTLTDGMLFLVSMVSPAAAAVSLALVICAAVGGLGVWMSQPSAVTLGCRWSAAMACSVITVLGADVPDGSALTSWITGLARHALFGQGKDCWLPGPGPPPGHALAAVVVAVHELHLGDAGQPGPHAEDVGPGADLRGTDAEGPEQLRGGDVNLSAPAAPGRRVLQRGTGRLEFDDVVRAERGRDGVRGLRHRRQLGPGHRPGGLTARPAAARPVRRVDDDLIRRHVGPGVVEDVAESLRGQHADQHGDQHAQADGGEG